MDSIKIEQQGLQALKPYLDKISAITDIQTLVATVADLKSIGSHTLFNNFISQDDKNSDQMSYKLWQGGIGLPEREYYFKTDSATIAIRSSYQNYITRVLTMSGEDSVKARTAAKKILSLEHGWRPRPAGWKICGIPIRTITKWRWMSCRSFLP